MPRLSEPGPLGMRAEHCYDFGALTGDSNLFVQVVAHIAAAAVLLSVLQYLKAGQITPLAKPTGGHRPLFMMSFLCRRALKSVMAAKKESVATCAGPLQYGVGRPDGANTMINTIQYLAEADSSRVLVAPDLKAAFQNGQAADAVTCSQSRYISAYRGNRKSPGSCPKRATSPSHGADCSRDQESLPC